MKDALGHGSDPRGGAQAPAQPAAQAAQPAQPATYQPGRFGRGDTTNFNPSPWLDARHARQDKFVADRQAASALAQNHPKSGLAPIHSAGLLTRAVRGVRLALRRSDG